jgi:hypothetical protein
MALNTLTVTVSSGVIGRPFVTAVNGLTAGSIVEIAEGGATGFGYSNGKLSHRALPYDTQLVILRERLTATGESKLTFLIVTAVGAYAIAQQAAGMSATARNVRVGGVVQNDGSVVSTLFVEDASGALISAAVGGAVVRDHGHRLGLGGRHHRHHHGHRYERQRFVADFDRCQRRIGQRNIGALASL